MVGLFKANTILAESGQSEEVIKRGYRFSSLQSGRSYCKLNDTEMCLVQLHRLTWFYAQN